MLMGPDGESIHYTPPPPPPPSPQQLQGHVTTAQTAVNQDQSRVQAVQGTLTQALSQDNVHVQQINALEASLAALQAQLKTDQAALNQAQSALNKSLTTQLTGQTTHAIHDYGAAAAHAPGAPNLTTATTNLQTATFNEEVLVYEQTHGGKCAVPGTKQWQQDAQSMLVDRDGLQTSRDVVASRHLSQLKSSGLDLRHFGAQEWAGEAVAQAELQDPQSADGALGKTPSLTQKKQGEQGAAKSLSSSLSSLPHTEIDPTLGRQALLGNGYVTTLGNEITHTMQDISGSKDQTTADGVGFLYHTVGGRGFDPALATALIGVAAPLLQQYLKDQTTASTDQASQAYVYTAGLYDVLLNAQQAGVPDSGKLAGQLAQWSSWAANGTDAAAAYNGRGKSRLDELLTKVQTKAQQQHVPANMLHAWEGLSQGYRNTGYGTDNVVAWGRFQTSLDGNAQLSSQALDNPSTLTRTTTPVLTGDQLHNTYDGALGLLTGQQRNGALPTDVNPVALAAVQTQMSGGYTAADQVPLARAMIAGQQQQLSQTWQQQHKGRPVLMPVDFLTEQAGEQVLGLGDQIGLGGPSWTDTVHKGEQGMQASLPSAPDRKYIDATNKAYDNLNRAQASGDQNAIATAQQALNQALMQELQAVYGKQFSGDTLIRNDENADWRYLAEVQVMRDHAGTKAMLQQVSAGLQAGEIIELSLGPGQTATQTVGNLDVQLMPFQQPGSPAGSDPITQAVLSDARVRGLVSGQVSAATTGSASDPTAALTREGQVLVSCDQSDPNGVVAQQIITGTLGSGLTQQIFANARSTAASSHDPLATAAPLMQAAQLSPSLTLAAYQNFNIPSSAHPGQAPDNQLIDAAGSVHSAADYRDLAIIYAALPGNAENVGTPTQLTQAQTAKAGLISAFGAELSQPHGDAAANIKSWIQASFGGTSSAPAWLANDLTTGYQYVQGDQAHTVGKLGNSDLVNTVKGALYQATGGGDSATPSPGSTVDMGAAASADGTTLQEFNSDATLTAYVAQAYGLQPTSGEGGKTQYDPNTVVYGHTTLGQIIADLKQQGGATTLEADRPIVLQAAPVAIGEQQGAQFRVQKQDGSTVWLGADGAVTPGWAGQDTALTHDLSTAAVQVVGGVTEADAGGNVNPLLKIDAPPPPPQHHPWWEDVAKDALAITAGIVATALTEGNVFVGFAAAFAVQQLFDAATNDGKVTIFKFGNDLIHHRANWKQFGIDTGTEAISAVADAVAPGAASWVSDKVAATVGTKLLTAAATDTATNAGTETVTTVAATTATETATTAGTETVTTAGIGAFRRGVYWVGGKTLAPAGAAAVQQSIQGVAGLGIATIDLAAHVQNSKLTWDSFGHAAAQQGLNVVVAIPTGGISGGFVPANIVAQTVAGFGTSVAVTEVDDRTFDHHDMTGQDWLTALIMTVPTTAQQYIDRPGGRDMIKQAFGRGADNQSTSSGQPASQTPQGPPSPPAGTNQVAGDPSVTGSGDPVVLMGSADPGSTGSGDPVVLTGSHDPTSTGSGDPVIVTGNSDPNATNAAPPTGPVSTTAPGPTSDPFGAASPPAQNAFGALFVVDSGRWTDSSWRAMNDYIDQALESPDPGLQAAARAARSTLGDPAGSSRGFIVSEDEATALGHLVSEDIRVTQGEILAARQAQWDADLAAASVAPDPSAALPTSEAVPTTEVSMAPDPNASVGNTTSVTTAEVSTANEPTTEVTTPAAPTGRARQAARTVKTTLARGTHAVSNARTLAAKTGLTAGLTVAAGVVAVRDPALALHILEHGGSIGQYVGGQLVNTDGVDWISRSMMLAYKTGTEIWDGHFGAKRMNRLLDGAPTKRDLRILELTTKRYARSNFDASNTDAVEPARERALAAIRDYAEWISQNGDVIHPGYRHGIDQAHVTANLLGALGSLHGMDSTDPHEIASKLFNRWHNRLRNRLVNNTFGTFTRAMNIAHNIELFADPTQRVDFTRAWNGMFAGRTGFGARLGDAGVFGDDVFYLPALAGEGLTSTARAIADVDRLASLHLGLGSPLRRVRTFVGNVRESGAFKKWKYGIGLAASAAYIPACMSWTAEDAFSKHAFAAKWLGDALVTAYCAVETHSLLPKSGQKPESGYPAGPHGWQNWRPLRWTQANVSNAQLLGWKPLSEITMENAFAYGIIDSDLFRPDVQQAFLAVAKGIIKG